ncbi:MAG: hypothetical protein MZV63_32200 [Marinilabiliales bacterium]|nr:hypothetical protein [Marinilabiliales bacterium]
MKSTTDHISSTIRLQGTMPAIQQWYLPVFHRAKTILGSASPSIESYNNALSGKYGLVELKERFGSIKLPDIILANSREAYRKKLMVSHFHPSAA